MPRTLWSWAQNVAPPVPDVPNVTASAHETLKISYLRCFIFAFVFFFYCFFLGFSVFSGCTKSTTINEMTAAIVQTETVATRIAAPLVTSSCERFIISHPRSERQFSLFSSFFLFWTRLTSIQLAGKGTAVPSARRASGAISLSGQLKC